MDKIKSSDSNYLDQLRLDSKGLDKEMLQMVIDTVLKLKDDLLANDKIIEFDQKNIFPEDIIRKMLSKDIGLHLLFIPEKYGGMGGDARDCAAVTKELSKICLGVATAFFAIQLGLDPILVGGTDDQKSKWLNRIAKGNDLIAYAVTEPEAGSNLALTKTKAEPILDEFGEIVHYKINGSKQFISNGKYADILTVLAMTDQGPSFFIVEKGFKGFTYGKSEIKHGIRASNTSSVFFEDVIVPKENLVGKVSGIGLKQANLVFGYTRLMVAAMALGCAEKALEIVISYAKQRVLFGTFLSEKQGYTHKLIIPNFVKLKAAYTFIEQTAKKIDSGVSKEDLQVEGSIAKLFTSEGANKACDDFIQALGGYGYMTEFLVEKIKRDVKITCIYEGTSEIQQNIISVFRWKKTRKTKGNFYLSLSRDLEEINNIYDDLGCFYYSLSAKILNEIINFVHNNKLTKKQFVMFAMSDMMSYVEVGASLASYVSKKIQKNPKNNNLTALKAISRIFASQTVEVINNNVLNIVMGTRFFDLKPALKFLEDLNYYKLAESYFDIVSDMDIVSDYLFNDQKNKIFDL